MTDEAPLRLASIVGVDVAGYSARTEADSSATARQIVALRTRIADIAARHHGRIFNTAGDGVMLEFASASDAVEAIYDLLDERPAREPEAHIGAHLGDVTTTENGDLLGHGVNVAARLMALAPAGRAVISQDLRAAAGSHAKREMRALGEVSLAKMQAKVHAFEIAPDIGAKLAPVVNWRARSALIGGAAALLVLAGGAAFWLRSPNDSATENTTPSPAVASQPAAAGATDANEARISIAVLPFVNMSSDEEQEYFSDGLSEELLNQLARIEGLRVTARTSSFAFKGKNEDLRVIGEKLGVANILEGSVRKSGTKLRITAQLISVSDGSHLWSDTFDRELNDVFAIQDEIATAVANNLRVALGVGPNALDYGGTKSFEAYDQYLKGLNEPWLGNESSTLDYFRQAVAIDPNYALAWAALATELISAQDSLEPSERTQIEAERAVAARRALELAPNLPAALIAEAYGQSLQHKWVEAESLIERTIANSAGNDPSLIQAIGWYYLNTGRYKEGQPYLERSRDLDPLQLSTSLALLRTYFTTQNWEKFDTEYRRSVDLDGERESLEFMQLARLVLAGADRQAIDAQAERVRAHVKFPGQGSMVDALAKITASPGDAAAILREERARGSELNTRLAIFAAYYGETDLALDILETVVEFGHPTVYQQFWNPQFSEIRKDPRFKQMMRGIGFADFWLKTGNWPDFCRAKGAADFECF